MPNYRMTGSDDSIKPRIRRIAIVGEPWDIVGPDVGTAISIISCELARCLVPNWQVTIYGRRRRGEKRYEIGPETIEFKRLAVYRKPQKIIEVILGILSCWTRRHFGRYIYFPISIIFFIFCA